jgi:GT2 family glycosyltransferase
LELIRHEANQGLGAARNTGIRAAKGEFVAFLDHDDLWAPGHVSSVMAAIRNEKAELGFCTVMLFGEAPENPLGLWGPPGQAIDAQLPFQLFESNFITPSSVIASKGLLNGLGGFSTDPKVHMCEDLDLWLRALSSGASFVHAKDITVHYRKHPAAATSRQGYMAYQAAYVRDLHQSRITGPWFKKRSIVAAGWWRALVALRRSQGFRWDILKSAIIAGIPVPWEIARGILHLYRIRIRHKLPHSDAQV